MSLDMRNWKEFVVGDIFDKEDIKKYSAIPATEGDVPFISSTSINNGVVKKVGVQSIRGNCITVSTNGSCFECFYHETPIVPSTDVEVLYSDKLNKHTAMFLCTILRREQIKYSYGNKPKKDKVWNTVIKLPATSDGQPDWGYMENYIKSLHYKPITTKNKQGSLKIDTSFWKPFMLKDLFCIETGKDFIYNSAIGNEHPVIGHGLENNGVACRSKTLNDYTLYDNKNTISMAHIGNYHAYVQIEPFYLGTRTKALKAKFETNKYILLFLSTIINLNSFKFSYNRVGSDKIPNEIIYLPVLYNEDGTLKLDNSHKYSEEGYIPDWAYMENYIKSLPYGDRI